MAVDVQSGDVAAAAEAESVRQCHREFIKVLTCHHSTTQRPEQLWTQPTTAQQSHEDK